MKRFFLSFLMLLTLINWFHTHAEAQVPTVDITTDSMLVNGNFDVTIAFSEAVTDFVVGDIDVTNGTATLGIQNGNEYPATITPTASATTVTVMIAAGAVKATDDMTSNSASNTLSVRIDRIAPTVSITQPSHIQKMAFMTTITFSEDVTGFEDMADVVLTGTAASGATIDTISPISARVYEVTITPDINGMKGDLVISVPASAATDTAGNGNAASSMSATVDYNPNAPTVDITHSLIRHADSSV